MSAVKPLPGAVHSSMRSGMVLFDLASVVEELVFNSVDAGAKKVNCFTRKSLEVDPLGVPMSPHQK